MFVRRNGIDKLADKVSRQSAGDCPPSTDYGAVKAGYPHPPLQTVTVSQRLVSLIVFEVSGCHKGVPRVSQAVTVWWMEGEFILLRPTMEDRLVDCRGAGTRMAR